MRADAPAPWVEPTNLDVAEETIRLVLLGAEPRRRYAVAWIASIAFVSLAMPRVGTYEIGLGGFAGAILGTYLGTTYFAVGRQLTLGRPEGRAWTAAFTVAAIYVYFLGIVAVVSSLFGTDGRQAPFVQFLEWFAGTFGFAGVGLFGLLSVLSIIVVVVRGRPGRRRYNARLKAQAQAEQAARAAIRAPIAAE